ncbi:3-mercaptopyruvate sulfurtransferase SseA, contains two rhodanese domains [Pseudomonas flavescens]|uniref:3-mercaptopyruvate sulfurtransferase SseA, contains two rhodanese domains n=1 Tax=Phytopseudomonas flavescens TaxID=29435 RepID=A0A1G8KA78_9GAMM|nr:rhodanese-like domain-containing protein [Pseudomonas flavescens]SDI40355.1 3-mercaptopyruvate sulfurtransferase SseA, contains two rhodanese domains [Pseudomonas flavescens]
MNRPFIRTILASSLVAAIAVPGLALAQKPAGIVLPQEQFQTLSQQKNVKVLDIRSKAEYDKGHIAGAIHLPWQSLNVSERDGIRNEYASDEAIERALSAAGISYADTLLIYGATSLAGRAFVVLEYAGFSDLHVLDGGLSQWKGKLVTQAAKPAPSEFKLTRKQENRIEKDYVASRVGDGKTRILDARVADATDDGVIPTAQALSSTSFVDGKTSVLRPRDELVAELKAKGISPDDEIVAYCGSGAAASSSYLFLKDLGYNNIKFYDKSWDEWSRDGNPQALGLGNFSFAGDALDSPKSLGPRFLNETEVKALQADERAIVVDVRAPADYQVGRIPESVNVFWNDTLDEQRSLKDAEALRALFTAQGVTPDKHVVIFARGGLQLAQSYTVLKLLGFEKVDAFEGKWEGWVNPAYGPSKG